MVPRLCLKKNVIKFWDGADFDHKWTMFVQLREVFAWHVTYQSCSCNSVSDDIFFRIEWIIFQFFKIFKFIYIELKWPETDFKTWFLRCSCNSVFDDIFSELIFQMLKNSFLKIMLKWLQIDFKATYLCSFCKSASDDILFKLIGWR